MMIAAQSKFLNETWIRSILLLAVCLLLAGPACGQDAQINASLGTDAVGVQDQFQLTVTVTGSNIDQTQTPKLPILHGIKVVAGPTLSTQFQWINGKTSNSRSYIYLLLPEKEGQFTIDPIEVKVGNQTFKTKPLSIRVTSATRAPTSPPQTSLADPLATDEPMRRPQPGAEVIVAAELDCPSVFVGQQVTLTYHLYTQVSVTGLQLQENPPLTGFWVENLEVSSKPTPVRKTMNGKEYLDYVIKKQALFPNAAGKIKIPSSTFAVSVKSTGDLFGFFAQADTLYRKTRELTIEVNPLPEQNRPAGFGSAVGVFTLAAELNKSEAATGDAVTLRLKLAGKGNLKAIPDVPLPDMPDLTVYSSKRNDDIHPVEENQIGGEKTWEYVLVPKTPGSHEIEPVSFSYFDPIRQKYETVSTQPLPLNVIRGTDGLTANAGLSGIAKQQLTRRGADINFIKLAEEDLQPALPPAYRSWWFILLGIPPVLFHGGAFLYRRRVLRQSGNAAVTRSRRARHKALDRLRHAEKIGKSMPRAFFDEAAAAMAGYLQDKFDLPEIAVTADSLERIMSGRSIKPALVQETMAALQECDFGRFVSASAAPERQKGLSDRIRGIVEKLEKEGGSL
jgi:hypothetical protein